MRPVPGARAALDRLRQAGLRLGVVTNQPGLALGLFTRADLSAVHSQVEAQLGEFDTWQVCEHIEGTGCRCRKPEPGLIQAAAAALGTTPQRCVVVGDTGRDVGAAIAAGATAILVPNQATRAQEVAEAPALAGDLRQAVDLVLRRQRLVSAGGAVAGGGGAAVGGGTATGSGRATTAPAGRVLVARPDSAGDVLVTGPAIRAVAAGADHVTLLCGPRGRAAAELLPGVDGVIEWRLPWIDPDPQAVDRREMEALANRVAAAGVQQALIFTSFHQSPLPLALILRMAGVGRIAAISEDYPGSLLDLRHRVPMGIPEPERALSLAAAAGFPLPPGEEPRLRLRADRLPAPVAGAEPPFLVVHPGASVPARAVPAERCEQIVSALTGAGRRVLVTGGAGERGLTARVAGQTGVDLGGKTTLAELAALVSIAGCLVTGNTGPAHLAAAVGTPVVSLFAPTVSFGSWGPWRVGSVRLGDAAALCRHSRASTCPLPGHPCLSSIEPEAVLAAVDRLESRVPEVSGR